MEWLKGKRTYIAAGGLALLGFAKFVGGDQVGALQDFLGALAVFGLRQALDTPMSPPPAPPQNPQPA